MTAGGFLLNAAAVRTAAIPQRVQRGAFLAIVLVVAAVAGLALQTDGLAIRRPELLQRFADVRSAMQDWAFPPLCGRMTGDKIFTACQLPKDRAPSAGVVLVLGDSIAQALYGRWAKQNSQSPMSTTTLISHGGCLFLVGVNRREAGYDCPIFVDRALDLAEQGKYQRVVVLSLWSGYFADGLDDICYMAGNKCIVAPREQREARLQQAIDALQVRLERIRRSGKDVTIMLTMPYSSFNVPRELSKRLFLGWPLAPVAAVGRRTFDDEDAFFRRRLTAMAAAIGADLMDPVKNMCDETACLMVDGDMRSLYRDSVHLRASVIQGARFQFLDRLVEASDPLAASRN